MPWGYLSPIPFLLITHSHSQTQTHKQSHAIELLLQNQTLVSDHKQLWETLTWNLLLTHYKAIAIFMNYWAVLLAFKPLIQCLTQYFFYEDKKEHISLSARNNCVPKHFNICWKLHNWSRLVIWASRKSGVKLYS